MDDLHRMLELVKDPNPQIRKYALAQVEDLADGVDDEDVLEALRDAARDSVPLVSHQAIRSLARLLGRAFLARGARTNTVDEGSFEGMPLAELRGVGLEILAPAIARLQQMVKSEDKRSARRALVALGKVAAPGTAPVMASCLGDANLAGAAAIALPGIGGEEALKPLVAAVRDPRSPGRLHAVLELGHFREPLALEALLELSQDGNAAVRANAAMALGEQEPSSSTRSVLGRLLSDPEMWVTVYAINSLSRDRSKEAAQLVATAYHKVEDPHVQASCVAVLGNMGEVARNAAEGVLSSAISHPDDRVRANAVEAVGRLTASGQAVLRMVCPLSTDPNNRVLANVAVAIAKHDLPAAVEVLERIATIPDKWFRTSAAWAAGVIGRPEAFPTLTRLATTEDATIQLMVVRSLEAFGGEALPLLTRLSAGRDSVVRARAAEALARAGGESVSQFLAGRFAQEPDPVTRAALVNALAATRGAGVVTSLVAALDDTFPRVQANAVEQLGRVGSLDVLSVVRPLARGENNRLRANAWIALWRLGELEMAEVAGEALRGTPDTGLFSAIFALGEMGRELRQLGRQGSNLLLLSGLKERARSGLSLSQASLPAVATTVTEHESDPELAMEAVLESLANGRPDEVEASLRRLPAGTPKGVASFLSSRMRVAEKDTGGALALLEEACRAEIPCLSPHLELANYYLRNRRDKEAAERFLAAYSMRTEALSGLAAETREALRLGKLSAASRLLKFLFGQAPMSADTHARVGHEYLALGVTDRAFSHLFLARIEFPRDVAVALDYAVAALRQGRRELARRVTGFARRAGAGDARVQARVAALDQSLGRGGLHS